MDEREFLAEQFEEHRTRLRAVAYRMLGSLSEADDAVQETWLRLNRIDADEVEFGALLEVLDPDMVLRADGGPAPGIASRVVRGAANVARQALAFSRLGVEVRPALVNGAPGTVSFRDGRPLAIAGFTIRSGRVVEMDILADPKRLDQLDLTRL